MTTEIPGYEILEELVPNAFGRAFRARQVSLDRIVLLTLLPPQDEESETIRLARTCASLTHPHLISGIDFGPCSEGSFLVTEWVEGPSVGEVVFRTGAIPEPRSLEIALGAARGLAAAAGAGLVHGAIGPRAVQIARGGTPKLRGFAWDRNEMTGAEDYRAPEVLAGSRPDARADIYSLGRVLRFMLTGRSPGEETPPRDEDPLLRPLREERARWRPSTREVIERMTALRPDDRPAPPGKLVEVLEIALRKIEEPAPPAFSPRGRRPGRLRRRRR